MSVLTRHLVSAPDPASLPDFDPKKVYLWLTRDNVELRERMLDHLKVCLVCFAFALAQHARLEGGTKRLFLRRTKLYKPNYYLSMYEFRDLTLRRLQLFVSQRFFSVFDYLHGAYWEGLRNNSCFLAYVTAVTGVF